MERNEVFPRTGISGQVGPLAGFLNIEGGKPISSDLQRDENNLFVRDSRNLCIFSSLFLF